MGGFDRPYLRGVPAEPPHISPARGPPLWDECGDPQMGEGVEVEPDWATDWDGAAQPAPDFDADQRVNGRQVKAAILTRCGRMSSESGQARQCDNFGSTDAEQLFIRNALTIF